MKHHLEILVILAFLFFPYAYGAVGCLTEEAELKGRAHLILEGEILSIAKVVVEPECDPLILESGKKIPVTYHRCGKVWKFIFQVNKRVRGESPNRLDVFVAPEMFLFALSCDDRPPVKEMKGIFVTLYLEGVKNKWWTLDGPNSIYVQNIPRTDKTAR